MVATTTSKCSSHRLIHVMGKVEIDYFFSVSIGIFGKNGKFSTKNGGCS